MVLLNLKTLIVATRKKAFGDRNVEWMTMFSLSVIHTRLTKIFSNHYRWKHVWDRIQELLCSIFNYYKREEDEYGVMALFLTWQQKNNEFNSHLELIIFLILILNFPIIYILSIFLLSNWKKIITKDYETNSLSLSLSFFSARWDINQLRLWIIFL